MKTLVVVLIAILAVIAIYGLMAAVLAWAWNLVIPVVFAGPAITFETAYAILSLLFILSFVFGGSKR